MVTTYKSLMTSLNQTISLTENHLIYTRKMSTDRFNPMWVFIISVLKPLSILVSLKFRLIFIKYPIQKVYILEYNMVVFFHANFFSISYQVLLCTYFTVGYI